MFEKIFQLFKLDEKQKARIISSYAKRIAEKYYTRFFETPWGKKLIAQGKLVRYAEEFLLYLISAYADKKLPEKTIFQMAFRDVFLDAFPEFAKRMLNGEDRHQAGKNTFATYSQNLPATIESDSSTKDGLVTLLRKGAQKVEKYLAKMEEEKKP